MRLRNFKLFQEAEVDFSPLTVFVGINGSGKSSLARALAMLPWGVERGLQRVVREMGGAARLFRVPRDPDSSQALTIEIAFDVLDVQTRELRGRLEHLLELNRSDNVTGYEVSREEINVFDPAGLDLAWAEAVPVPGGAGDRPRLSVKGDIPRLGAQEKSTISPERIRKSFLEMPCLEWSLLRDMLEVDAVYPSFSPVRVDPTSPYVFRVGWDSAGWLDDEALALHDFLAGLAGERKEYWLRTLSQFLPWVVNIDMERDFKDDAELVVSELNGQNFHSLDVSDGTLMLIGRLAMLESSRSILIIDEPEAHLHPDAIDRLMAMYRSHLDDPATSQQQLIIFTQSPHVVRHCRPEELRIVERTGNRSVVYKADEDPGALWQRLQRAGMTLDEAWLSNLFGGTSLSSAD